METTLEKYVGDLTYDAINELTQGKCSGLLVCGVEEFHRVVSAKMVLLLRIAREQSEIKESQTPDSQSQGRTADETHPVP